MSHYCNLNKISLFVRLLALQICTCYVISPLQNKISSVLHTVSHAIEELHDASESDLNATHSYIAHNDHHHELQKPEHHHGFIDFLDVIFDTSGQNGDSDSSPTKKIKIDKHIVDEYLFEKDVFVSEHQRVFVFDNEPLRRGHLKKLKEPPRFSQQRFCLA